MAKKETGKSRNSIRLLLVLLVSLLFFVTAGCGGKDEKNPETTPLPSESAIPSGTEIPMESQPVSSPLAMDPSSPIAGDSQEINAGDSDIALATQEFSAVPNVLPTAAPSELPSADAKVLPSAAPGGLSTSAPKESAPAEQPTQPLITIAPVQPAPLPDDFVPLPTDPAAVPTAAAETTLPMAAPTAKPTPTPVPKAPRAIAPSAYMSYRELVGDNGDYSMPHDVPSYDTYKILIDVTNQVMTVYDKKSGEIVRQMLCTTGKKDTPTPRGIKKMGKGRARFGFFKDYDCYAQYCTQVVQGIYIHSVLYREKNAKTLIRSSYRNLGRPSSHGCIRLAVPDARWIFYNIAPKTECEIKALKKDDALRRSLRLASPPSSKK